MTQNSSILNSYSDFVKSVTSEQSENTNELINILINIDSNNKNINTSLLLTSAIGLSSESGEFSEIIKKVLFQGKPINEKLVHQMKKELGDVMWYWISACRALQLDPNDVINENISKLKNRYTDGTFKVEHSENRHSNDK